MVHIDKPVIPGLGDGKSFLKRKLVKRRPEWSPKFLVLLGQWPCHRTTPKEEDSLLPHAKEIGGMTNAFMIW